MAGSPGRIVLASGSPRRRDLLTFLGVDFEAIVSGFEEPSTLVGRPALEARWLAVAKARVVARTQPDALVLAADTVVVLRGRMLGKPEDAEAARAMLRALRGRVHRVITAVALVTPERLRPRPGHEVSRVRMRPYLDQEIEAAIAAGVPFDKAGGYGIQDPVLHPVETCEGCYCNVMGLPLWTVARLLESAGVHVSRASLPERCLVCPARPDPGAS